MLDQTTLFAVNLLISLTGTVVFYFNWRGNRQMNGLLLFFVSYAVIFLASALLFLASDSDLFVLQFYLGFLFGTAIGLHGFTRFWAMQAERLLIWIWSVTSIAALIVLYMTLIEPGSEQRLIVAALFAIVMHATGLTMIVVLYRKRRIPENADTPQYGVLLLGFSLVLGAATQLARLYSAAMVGGDLDNPEFDSFSATLWFLDSWRSMFLIIAIILMTSEVHQDSLRRLAMIDPLTGLFNRRAFERLLRLVLNSRRRSDGGIGLAMLDIDHFKKINDTYGHEAGDMALRQFAEVIATDLRQHDICCRYGGEEFLLLLTDVNESLAMEIAERIRMRVAESVITLGKNSVSMTVSIGLVVTKAESFEMDRAIRQADQALYQAKSGGRNLCVLASPEA